MRRRASSPSAIRQDGEEAELAPRSEDYIREDVRYIHDMYLMEVKAPSESRKPWDYLKTVATIPGNEAFTKLADSKCPLVKK